MAVAVTATMVVTRAVTDCDSYDCDSSCDNGCGCDCDSSCG